MGVDASNFQQYFRYIPYGLQVHGRAMTLE